MFCSIKQHERVMLNTCHQYYVQLSNIKYSPSAQLLLFTCLMEKLNYVQIKNKYATERVWGSNGAVMFVRFGTSTGRFTLSTQAKYRMGISTRKNSRNPENSKPGIQACHPKKSLHITMLLLNLVNCIAVKKTRIKPNGVNIPSRCQQTRNVNSCESHTQN